MIANPCLYLICSRLYGSQMYPDAAAFSTPRLVLSLGRRSGRASRRERGSAATTPAPAAPTLKPEWRRPRRFSQLRRCIRVPREACRPWQMPAENSPNSLPLGLACCGAVCRIPCGEPAREVRSLSRNSLIMNKKKFPGDSLPRCPLNCNSAWNMPSTATDSMFFASGLQAHNAVPVDVAEVAELRRCWDCNV